MCIDFIAYYPKLKVVAGADCGVESTCGSYSFSSPSRRQPVDFGTECEEPNTVASSPTVESVETYFAPVYASLQKHARAHLISGSTGGLRSGRHSQVCLGGDHLQAIFHHSQPHPAFQA